MNCPHCGHPLAKAGLTLRQQNCLDFVKAYIGRHGVAPSYSEIADDMGLKSKNSVHRHIVSLEERGAIVRLPFRERSLSLVQ